MTSSHPDREQAREAFVGLVERLNAELRGEEILFCEYEGEASDFVRLNQNRIRQAGHVHQASLTLSLIEGRRQSEADCDLGGDPNADFARARDLLLALRERLRYLPDDPYLQFNPQAGRSCHWPTTGGIDAVGAVGDIIAAADGLDLVGIWASGEVSAGLASSVGHRHWHVSDSFQFDWSCHGESNRAVKGSLGGADWTMAPVRQRIDRMRGELELMARPLKTIPPGRYRAWLAPMAVEELTSMLGWDGFDLKSQRTRQTPLLQWLDGEQEFHSGFSLAELHGAAGPGLLPSFTSEGFERPDVVTLIDHGQPGEPLVDARAGREFGLPVNAGSGYPQSLGMEPGDLAEGEVLVALGTGLLIGNLWYCNWSDPNCARVTGMTRFGTYWVEDGKLIGPVAPMRFDDSLYGLFGERLIAIGAEAQLLVSAETYGARRLDSARLPGILIEGLNFAL